MSGMHFELSDFPLDTQKKILRKIAEEDRRKENKKKRLEANPEPDYSRLPWSDETDYMPPTTPKEKKKPKRNKYKSEKITTTLYDGSEYTFDSKKEYRRYQELEIMQLAGEISDLKLQVHFLLIPKQKLSTGKTERKCEYVADFVYTQDGKTVVEDVKGYRQGGAYRVYSIKRKLMKYVHDIEVIEV